MLIPDDGARACGGVGDAPAAAAPSAAPTTPVVEAEEASVDPFSTRHILGPGSSVNALKERLEMFGQPIYGEKAILWRRLAADAERRESARLGVVEEASRRHAAMRGGKPSYGAAAPPQTKELDMS